MARKRKSAPATRPAETHTSAGSADDDCFQVLKIAGDEADCGRLRGSARQEAPPGFEPGMADLQSAALPLGEGAAFNPRHGREMSGAGQSDPRESKRVSERGMETRTASLP